MHKKVLRLMRESALLCRVRRKWVKTTDSKHPFPKFPYLIKDMVVSRMNQVWLADITYIRIRNGFVYLAGILDAYSRRVVGYAISAGLETSLTAEALRMALEHHHTTPGIIHHSDQGVQNGPVELYRGTPPVRLYYWPWEVSSRPGNIKSSSLSQGNRMLCIFNQYWDSVLTDSIIFLMVPFAPILSHWEKAVYLTPRKDIHLLTPILQEALQLIYNFLFKSFFESLSFKTI